MLVEWRRKGLFRQYRQLNAQREKRETPRPITRQFHRGSVLSHCRFYDITQLDVW
jgi:hypothetical protein